MESASRKLYHIHGIDSRDHLDLYLSGKEDMVFKDDFLRFPMANLHYMFSSGLITGKYLIDAGMGSFIHHLFSACNFFKEIVILKLNEKCIMELSRWVHDRTGAYDWMHASAIAANLEGKSDQFQDKEMCLKSSIKHIVKCNFEQENITAPVLLPLADCIVSSSLLELISENEDEYMKNLTKILKLLKPGGHLLLFTLLYATYFTAGEERLHILKCDENFVKNALSKSGLVIDYCAVQRRGNVSDLTDYGAFIFIAAHKEE